MNTRSSTVCVSVVLMGSLVAAMDDPAFFIERSSEVSLIPKRAPSDVAKHREAAYLLNYRKGFDWAENSDPANLPPTNLKEKGGDEIRGWIEGWQAGVHNGGTNGLPAEYARFVKWNPSGFVGNNGLTDENRWSEPVNFISARLRIKSDRRYKGTRILEPYLELRNLYSRVPDLEIPLNRDQITISVTDRNGNPVPTSGSWMRFRGGDRELGVMRVPFNGTISLNLGDRNAIWIGSAAHLGLGSRQQWSFRQGDVGPYFLQATIVVDRGRDEGNTHRRWYGTIQTPQVEIPVAGH